MSLPGPDTVLADLKQQAQRKASLRMFYAASDFLREYRGPYAQETAVEREQLATEYHNMGKAAEEARWGSGGVMPTVAPPTRNSTPTPPRPVTPPKPRPASTKPASTTPPKPRGAKVPEYQLEGDKMVFPCRWCKEPVAVPTTDAGKYLPCPKCDGLLSVPKLA